MVGPGAGDGQTQLGRGQVMTIKPASGSFGVERATGNSMVLVVGAGAAGSLADSLLENGGIAVLYF